MSTIRLSKNTPARPVRTIEDAVATLAPPPKTTDLIGIEAEAFLVDANDASPARAEAFVKILSSYKKKAGFRKFATEKTSDGSEIIIGLSHAKGQHAGAEITVEPGFQPEYGAVPQSDLHKAAALLDAHLDSLAAAAQMHGHLVTMPGLHPLYAGEDLPLIGKKRYALMTRQAAKKAGIDGLTAMRGTTGIQYNLDTSQDNWARRYRVAFALQPFVSALSANSPFKDGESTGDASHRSVLWFKNWGGNWAQDIAETVFADDFSLSKLTHYIAGHLPLPFLVRPDDKGNTNYINVGGRTLKQLMAVRPAELGSINETDVGAMVGFAFLPVKPKKNGVIELRGADGSYPLRIAQGALQVGILYDDRALEIAEGLLESIDSKNYVKVSEGVARSGLGAIIPGYGSVRETAKELLAIAHKGLERRGLGEEVYLQTFVDIANRKRRTPSDELDERARELARTKLVSLQTALRWAFLETAVPIQGKVARQPDHEHGLSSSAAKPFAL